MPQQWRGIAGTMLYFSYGLNMDPDGMARRCPRSRFVSLATLPNHRFRVTCQGVATVVPARGHQVPGVLWRVAIADLSTLDGFEGVTLGIYRKRFVHVRTHGRTRRALIYTAAVSRPGYSGPGYMDAVVRAAEAAGLPEAHVARLKKRAGNSCGRRQERPYFLTEDY